MIHQSIGFFRSTVLHEQIRAGMLPAPDLTLSSAADLQIKLVNDGK